MRYQRRKIFIDSRLQGRLILALVLLEIAILAVAVFYLNSRFSGIIEHDLYAIHRNSQTDLLSVFAEQIGWVVFEMVLLNAMMLFIAHYIWSQQVSSVVQAFRNSLYHIRSMQFFEPEPAGKQAHELLSLLNHWYSKEYVRIKSLKNEIRQIDISDEYQNSDLQAVRDRIKRCLHLL